jgi:3-methylcrotonyl-CoA carboxylase beta subunit
MTVLTSSLERRSEAFAANAASMRALVADLREKIAVIREGRGRARRRHLGAANCCRGNGCGRCLIPGRPFSILAAAAYGMYDGSAGRRHYHRYRVIMGRECVVVANDATVGGSTPPLTVVKHLRAQEIAGSPASISSIPAGVLPAQDEVFPTAAFRAHLLTRRGSAAGIPQVASSWARAPRAAPASGDGGESVMCAGRGRPSRRSPLRAATGEVVTGQGWRGRVHSRVWGLDHYAPDDRHASGIRASSRPNRAKSIPLDGTAARAALPGRGDLRDHSAGHSPAYEVREVIAPPRRGSEFDEFAARPDFCVRLCLICGYPVGIPANNGILPERLKGAHFIELRAQRGIRSSYAEYRRVHGWPQIRGGRHRQRRCEMVTAVATAAVPSSP